MKRLIILGFVIFMSSCSTQNANPPAEPDQEVVAPSNPPPQGSSSFVQPKEPLLGRWNLDYINPELGKDISHFKIQKPYLQIVDRVKVAGNNGCNNIAGEYSADHQKITFHTDKFLATRMFCEGVDENIYKDALASITSYAIMEDGQKLVLSSNEVITLVFTKLRETKPLE